MNITEYVVVVNKSLVTIMIYAGQQRQDYLINGG